MTSASTSRFSFLLMAPSAIVIFFRVCFIHMTSMLLKTLNMYLQITLQILVLFLFFLPSAYVEKPHTPISHKGLLLTISLQKGCWKRSKGERHPWQGGANQAIQKQVFLTTLRGYIAFSMRINHLQVLGFRIKCIASRHASRIYIIWLQFSFPAAFPTVSLHDHSAPGLLQCTHPLLCFWPRCSLSFKIYLKPYLLYNGFPDAHPHPSLLRSLIDYTTPSVSQQTLKTNTGFLNH